MTQEPYDQEPREQPPAAPTWGTPPEQPPAAPAAPPYGTQPPQPPYGTQPPQPPYGAPAQGAPTYGAPPAYGTPPPHGAPPSYGAPGQPYQGAPSPVGAPLQASDEKTYSLLAHLGGILGCLGWLPALIIYNMYKNRGPFITDQAREALNFQLTMLIAYVAAQFVVLITPVPGYLGTLLWIANVVFCVLAAVSVNNGQQYRYPVSLRLVK